MIVRPLDEVTADIVPEFRWLAYLEIALILYDPNGGMLTGDEFETKPFPWDTHKAAKNDGRFPADVGYYCSACGADEWNLPTKCKEVDP